MALILQPKEDYPQQVPAVLVDTRATWAGDWKWDRELVPLRVQRATAGQDLERCELRRVYGRGKLPQEAALGNMTAKTYPAGTWVRVQVWGRQPPGVFTVFVGQLGGEGRDVMGSTAHGATGEQHLVAYGPLAILRQTIVTRSFWYDLEHARTITADWLPGMNDFKRNHDAEANNRSDYRRTPPGKVNATYIYGGSSRWTHYDYLEYVLKQFVQRVGGPVWSLSPSCEVLKLFSDSIRFGGQQTAAEIVRKLVPIRYGLEWTIDSTAAGFEIRVFPLSAQGWDGGAAWAGATSVLPANPRRFTATVARTKRNTQTRLSLAGEHRYRYIRVVGKRTVVCCTLKAAYSDLTLRYGWSDYEETAYLAGTGNPADSAEKHDQARAGARFRNVFSAFRAPNDWDHQKNDANMAATEIGLGTSDQYQNWQRNTLTWTPMKTGFDYASDPPRDLSGGNPAELMPPAAWIGVPRAGSTSQSDMLYWPVEKHGMHVAALNNDLGIRIEANPNHLLAKEHWTSAAPTKKNPKWDWRNLIVTLAFETDLRPQIRWETGDPGAEGEFVIEVPDAELWVLSPNTVFSAKPDGTLITVGPAARIVRNDMAHLQMVMAGAKSRYAAGRARAEIVQQGIWPLQNLLGQIMTALDDGHGIQNMAAPITQCTWQFEPSPQTTLHAGFAGGGMQVG